MNYMDLGIFFINNFDLANFFKTEISSYKEDLVLLDSSVYGFEIKASSYGLDFNGSLTDNYKRSLTQYFTPKHIINPSKQVYISLPNKTIFQENRINFTINKEPKENIIDYLDEDYSLKHPSLEVHSKVVVDSIKKAYYEV